MSVESVPVAIHYNRPNTVIIVMSCAVGGSGVSCLKLMLVMYKRRHKMQNALKCPQMLHRTTRLFTFKNSN